MKHLEITWTHKDKQLTKSLNWRIFEKQDRHLQKCDMRLLRLDFAGFWWCFRSWLWNLHVQFYSDSVFSAADWQPVNFSVSRCCWPHRCSWQLPSHVFRCIDTSLPSCRSADRLNCCNIHRRRTETYLRMTLNSFAFNVLFFVAQLQRYYLT